MSENIITAGNEQAKYFPYQDKFHLQRHTFWEAGQDSYTLPPAQDPDKFVLLQNVEPVLQGNLQRRRGYQLLSSQTPSIPYREGYSFRSELLNLRSIVYTSTSTVLVINEDGSANIANLFTPSIAAISPPRMVLSRNYGYFADGIAADNLKWDGTPNSGNVTNWGIDINDVAGLIAGPNAPGTATDLGLSGSNASQGPNSPTAASNDPFGFGLNWTSITNVFAPDGASAFATFPLASPNDTTDYIKATGYNFSIPGTATITGIVVKALVSSDTNAVAVSDTSVRLYKAGVVTGTNHANGVSWTATPAYQTYGSSTDLWGTTWTPTDINNIGFGAALAAINTSSNGRQGAVDYISITVYYTVPLTGSWTNPNNIKMQDGLSATAVATTSQSSELQATNFGFAASGVVAGIQVDIKLSTSSGSPTIHPVLTKNSAVYGARKTATITNTGLSFVTFGGPTDLWNGVWSLADVNSANFGCQFYVLTTSGSPTVSVDFVRITIFSTVAPPSIAISGTGITLLSGTVYTIAFQNSITGHVSDFSPFSANTGPLTNQGITISSIPVSLDPQVDQKLILRPADGADTTTLFLVASIPNATTTYNDSMPDTTLLTQPVYQETQADGTLHGIANNKVPPTISFPTKHKGRIFGTIQNTLYFSKNLPDVTTSSGTITSKWEEAWPRTNQLDMSELAETISGMLSDGETLWIGTEKHIRRLVGDSPQNFQQPEIQFNNAGLYSQDTWQIVFAQGQPVGAMWLTPDFKIMGSDFNTYTDVGWPVQNILNTINRAATVPPWAMFVSNGPAEYYILSIPTNSNSTPDTCLVYDLDSKTWFTWIPTDSPTGGVFLFDVVGAPRWTFATNAGSIYEWTPNVRQDRANNTPVSYAVTAKTSWLDLGDPTLRKALNQIIVGTGDTGVLVTLEGAVLDSELDNSPNLIVSNAALLTGPLTDLYVPLASLPTRYRWYRWTFTSPASLAQDVVDFYNAEAVPLHRW